MGCRRWLFLVMGLCLSCGASAQDRPIVAVFILEVKGAKIDKGAIDRLTDYLGSPLPERFLLTVWECEGSV